MPQKSLYHQLPNADSIRLFKVNSAESYDTPLSGNLIVVRRPQCQQYRALSYMWGPLDPTTDQELLVNDHILPIRANIASCLRAYRDHLRACRIKENPPLWIDLICIQQDCIQEKNHQVQQMGAIYEQAKSVLVWLRQNTKVDIIDYFRGNSKPMSLTSERPRNVAELRLLFRSLLNQHWTRTWIVQELCLAQKIAIFTEKLVFQSRVLEQIQTERAWVDEVYSSGWLPSAEYPNPHAKAIELIDRFSKIWSVRDSRRDSRWKPLNLCSTIYQLGRDSDCSHHRDRVFAFLQMCSSDADIEVDYERDETLIFWDVLVPLRMEELEFQEIDCLREVLQLTWLRLLRTVPEATESWLKETLLPCYLDCGTLTLKVSRKRSPLRRCRKRTETYNCWFQTNSTSTETMFRIVLNHMRDRMYRVTELYCRPSQSDDLYGNLLKNPAILQLLDETWVARWETVAVSPCLFVILCVVSSLDLHGSEDDFREAFPDATRVHDPYIKQTKATKRFGMCLA